MKYILLPAIVLLCFSFRNAQTFTRPSGSLQDSVKHVTDGLATEWQGAQFHPDDDSTVFMAADNDQQNLYVVLTIPDFSMQSKIMRNGMKLFTDLKEKKKENYGIEFPVAGEVNDFIKETFPVQPAGEQNTGSKQQPDKKRLRSMMSLALVSLKIFGLPSATKDEQGLKMPGSVQVAFKWDETDAMHIEYAIPLSLLNLREPVDQRSLHLGWKVNGFETPGGSDGKDGEGRHHGGHMNGGMQGSNGSGMGFNGAPGKVQRKMSMAEMARVQNFWTTYSFSSKKAF